MTTASETPIIEGKNCPGLNNYNTTVILMPRRAIHLNLVRIVTNCPSCAVPSLAVNTPFNDHLSIRHKVY